MFEIKRVLKPNKLEKQDLVEIRDKRKRDGKRKVFSIEKTQGRIKEIEDNIRGNIRDSIKELKIYVAIESNLGWHTEKSPYVIPKIKIENNVMWSIRTKHNKIYLFSKKHLLK